ncbi:hypothetical protein HID58_013755 [Brassica napus]|uniref:EF-hand domain-containing protein n=1 Tax=Brassica napus TaxID=3708 RepID=A0ABQ7XH55_BRANA|nr:hypothetical protein HID58_013755 [Brassica napus]
MLSMEWEMMQQSKRFSQVDSDNDGRINYEEFCAMMRSGNPQQQQQTTTTAALLKGHCFWIQSIKRRRNGCCAMREREV